MAVAKSNNLNPSEADIRQVKEGDYMPQRIDINYMFKLGSNDEVNTWLRAAEFTSKTRHGRPVLNKNTVYWGKNSRRWAVKAYNKAEEILAKNHGLPDTLKNTKLPAHANSKLRIEVVLRKRELTKLGIEKASQIQTYGLNRLFNEYVEKIDMSQKIILSDEQKSKLPHKLQATYSNWQHGEDLVALLPRATFYRHRKELLKHGIDITTLRPKDKAANVVPLVRVLEAGQVEIPEWALKYIHQRKVG
jgi:II/X family phage/plasmid replication protein